MATLYLIADRQHSYTTKCWPISPIKTVTYVKTYGIKTCTNYNFNPNDGLTTTCIINDITADNIEHLTHIIVTMDDGGIATTYHWFVTSYQYVRAKQWQLNLVRDVVTDYWTTLGNSNAVITRANSIYAEEKAAQYKHTTQLSQVKSGEILLTEDADNSCGARGWLVGYLNKSYVPTDEEGEALTTTTFKTSAAEAEANIINMQSISVIEFIQTVTPGKDYNFAVVDSLVWHLQSKRSTDVRQYATADFDASNNTIATWTARYPIQESLDQYLPYVKSGKTMEEWFAEAATLDGESIIEGFCTDNAVLGFTTEDPATSFINTYAGKVIHFKDGYYRLNVDRTNGQVSHSYCGDTLREYLLSTMSTTMSTAAVTDIKKTQMVEYAATLYTITLSPYDADFIYTTYSVDHQSTIGANYDIFMCPLGGDLTYINADGKEVTTTINENNTRAMISAMMRQLVTGSNGNLYDVQWLPYGYCLRKDLPTINTSGSTRGLTADGTASLIYSLGEGEKPVGCGAIFWCSSNQNNFTITRDFIPANDTEHLMENRIKQETYKWRLSSPNWANGFDFSAVNNDGLQGVDIYCTFKPYQPYIRVAPHFKNLYGAAYNDSRGLILGGEFSIEQVTDAWQQYQLTNKNYQAIFNRQMQTLDLQQKVSAENDKWSLAAATVGAVSGIAADSMRGAMIGGAAGAIVGGVASTIGAGVDISQSVRNYQNSEALRSDARSAALDNFQYQIGNIQATPLGLSRIDSFNIDYRVYPVIEVFKCTTEELQNLRKSIKWNGIDINQCGDTNEVLLQKHLKDADTEFNYVAATLIRPIDKKNGSTLLTHIPTAQWLALAETLQGGIYTIN